MMKMPNAIKREIDPLLCIHSNLGMCQNCMPIPSYDEEYQKKRNIKHLSFYSYYHKCGDAAPLPPSGASVPYTVEMPELSVKVPCPSGTHKPWPEGICTSCTPPSVTLQRQAFRMVDHVEFENAHIIERFVEYWRITGKQRYGYLYGKYAPYLEVPLGIKAIVCAIYEPPQEDSADGIQLTLPNTQLNVADAMSSKLGLTRLGVIYTDLLDDCTGTGKVVCKRHVNSYYLSSAECIMSAKMQLSRPTYLKYARDRKFSSRAVTCVISGNPDGHIDVSCYQVSVVCEALVKAGLVYPCVDPCLMKLAHGDPLKVVPAVSYTKTDSFGLKKIEAANPTFPTDYLIVTCSHGFLSCNEPAFISAVDFAIENRESIKKQMLCEVAPILKSSSLLDSLSDFHLLLFLTQCEILDQDDLEHLYSLVLDPGKGIASLISRDNWGTLETIAGSITGSPGTGAQSLSDCIEPTWDCTACTYENVGSRTFCEMCDSRRPDRIVHG